MRGRYLCRICRCNWHYTILYFLTLQNCTIVITEGNEIFVLGGIKGSFVGRISRNSHYGWSPTCKGIGVFSRCLFCRFSMSRNQTILNNRLVYQRAIFILPGNSITILCGSECCFISLRTLNLCNGMIPSVERVGIFSSILLHRIRRSNRCLSVFIVLAADNRIILIQECNQILTQSRSICCSISSSLRYNRNSRRPSRKRIIILRSRFLGWICRRNRHYAIFYFLTLQFCTILVAESNKVLVHNAIKLCRINCIARSRYNYRIPTLECIGVLYISCFCRSFPCICRSYSEHNIAALKYRAIIILECNGCKLGMIFKIRIGLCFLNSPDIRHIPI